MDVKEIQTLEHDVVVIGAGGAGLRAAIECSARGLNTGLIMKSLLGKAHTVMAEGGMAAALGNADARDDWKIHFRDTMRGGKFLNVWRMAELHAREAPDRVRELEEWGAVFDRTKDGLINQRNFGGHRYPRLAHVGDRTGLELIRTLQDHGIHQGIHTHMECTALQLLKDGDRIAGVAAYWRETGRFVLFRCKAVILATGGAGKAWKVTSNSWEYTGDGLAMAYEAGAELMDLEFTQFHPTGMVWPLSVRGILVTEGVRGDGGILKNSDGKRFMFELHPGSVRAGDGGLRGGGRAVAGRQGRCASSAGAAHAGRRGASHHRGGRRPAAGRRTAVRSSTSPRKCPQRTSNANFHPCTISSRNWPRSTSPRSRWRSGPPCITSWVASAWTTRIRQETKVPGLFAVRRVPPPVCMERIGSGATPSPTCWSSVSLAGIGAASSTSDELGQHAPGRERTTRSQVNEIMKQRHRHPLNRESGPNPYVAVHEHLQGDHAATTSALCGYTRGPEIKQVIRGSEDIRKEKWN